MPNLESLKKHQKDYKEKAYENYTENDLLWFTYLLLKRSTHRMKKEKAEKDVYDATSYLKMIMKKRGLND